MTDANATDGARHELFEQLDGVRAGLLGLRGSEQHPQPMNHFAHEDTATLWFITSRETDLARAVTAGDKTGLFLLTGKKHQYWSSVTGPIAVSDDKEKLDELWSPIAAAWFDEGRDDKGVCLLRMDMRQASIWTATGNPLIFGLEIARSNISEDKKPDLGKHHVLDFPGA